MQDDAPPPRKPTEVKRPAAGATGDVRSEDSLVGMQIGDTRLVGRIGEGGMGLVYEGWQEPPGRQVAAKLLRDAVATEEARIRFEHEARVLASLRHPAIAQVYRAGTHRDGREFPYFLMEFVPGARTLADYTRHEKLTLEATLKLASRVCRGVQAGHAKGVIHRDLKPENILIDGDGNPKIIDFGIARVARQDETAHTPKTTTGEVVGTVPYMSPEQFTGERNDVDTRTDVYALGVVLYETLTGQLPFEFEGLGILDIIRMIQTKAPASASKLRGDLAGDVELILGKALAKDPAQRYASAAALADDIDRFVARQPILARPPSVRYQLRMYARRHRGAAAAALGVLVTLVGALIAISVFATGESQARQRSEREEARARALLHESARFVPVVADHLDHQLGRIVGTSRARNLMATELEELAGRLSAIEGASDDPEVSHALGSAELAVANIRGGAGGANLGELSASVERFERAVAHLQRAHAAQPTEPRFRESLAAAQITLADQRHVVGKHDQARAALQAADATLARAEATTPDDPAILRQRIAYERTLGHIEWQAEHREASLAAYVRAQKRIEAFPWRPAQARAREAMLLTAHLDLARIHVDLARADEARRHVRALTALTEGRAAEGVDAASLVALWHVHSTLGEFASLADEHEIARDHQQKALDLARRAARDDPHDAAARLRVRVSRGALGTVLEALADHEGARSQHAEAVAELRLERQRDPENARLEWDLRVALTRLAAAEGQNKAWRVARRLLAEARALQRERVLAHPGRAEEIAGAADVEYAEATVFLAEAAVSETLQANIEAYRGAIRHLEAGVSALARIESQGTLRPQFQQNIALWRSMIEQLQEAIRKLEALR